MKAASFVTLAAGVAVSLAASAQQEPALKITAPAPEAIASGPTRIAATVVPQDIEATVKTVTFSVDGRLVCTIERPPFSCTWDTGDIVRGHHVRVVATLGNGRRLVDNLHTHDPGYTERVQTDAVLVPVIVTRGGQFVRGLKRQDFDVAEDGVRQSIASLASEDAPLDLVLAIDISGSMESSLDRVRVAVKRLLSKLRPGDAATVAGFNDTMFLAAERETDPQVRDRAVDLLTAWGGTALYDATVRSIDLVSSDWGRKGIVIFSDGDDRDSLLDRESATARVQASDAMLYTIGFGAGVTVPELRSRLEQYARATGGRAFFPRGAAELDSVFDEIVAELANQYVLSYSPADLKQDDRWRAIDVHVRGGKYDVRAREGYRPKGAQRQGR